MKTIVTIIFSIIFSLLIANSETLPFKVEAMIADFNGTTSNQSCIIAYGSRGVIMRTPDYGKTWEQQNLINDSAIIRKIITINNNFYGVTDEGYLLKSDSSGRKWEIKNPGTNDSSWDICSDGNSLFVLKSGMIEIYDLDLNKTDSFNINNTNQPMEMAYLNGKIYLPADGCKIYAYDINNNYSVSYFDLSKISNQDSCAVPVNLRIDRNLLYFQDNNFIFSFNSLNNNFAIADTGLIGVYRVYKGKIFSLSEALSKRLQDAWGIMYPKFYKADSVFNNTQIAINHQERFVTNIFFKDFQFINDDTIIAVGAYKEIYFSYDGGIDWVLKCDAYNASGCRWFNDSTAFSWNNYQVIKTTDKGVIWLPQQHNSDTLINFYNENFLYYDSTGNILFINMSGDQNVINCIISHDFGETFFTESRNEFIGSISLYLKYSIKSGNNLLIISPFMDGSRKPVTEIYKLDSDFNTVDDTFRFKYGALVFAKRLDDGRIIGIDLENPSAVDNPDSVIYWVMYSSDEAKTWVKDFSFKIKEKFWGSNFFYFGDGQFIFSSYLPDTLHKGWNVNYLCKIDTVAKKVNDGIFFDSLSSFNGIFKYQDKYYMPGYLKFYVCDDLVNNSSKWKIYPQNYNLGATKVIGDSFYISAVKSYNNQTLLRFSPNSDTLTEVRVEYKPYLYAFPPYPNPAANEIKSLVYYQNGYTIDKNQVSVCNIMGDNIAEKGDITITQASPISVYITWDCRYASPGVYFIVVRLEDATKTIPVVVEK